MSNFEMFGLLMRGVMQGGLALWVYSDVRRRERSMLWTLGTFLIPEAFFPLYFWNQIPELTWTCPQCHRRNRIYSRQCRQCSKLFTSEETVARLQGFFEISDAVVILLIALLIQDLGYSISLLIEQGFDTVTQRAELLTLETGHFWFVKLVAGNVLVVLCVYCITIRCRRTLEAVGLKYNGNLRHLAVSLLFIVPMFVGFVALYGGVAWLADATGAGWLSQLVSWERQQRAVGMPETLTVSSAVLIGFALLILLPIGEEILFRGIALPALADRFGLTKGVVLSALLFALAHGFFRHFTPLVLESLWLFPIGILIASLRVRFRSLLPGLVVHCGLNLASLVIWFGWH